MTDHVAYPGCYCADCVEGMPHERHNDLRGYIVGNGDRTKWRAWINGMPAWVDDPADATRYGFRSDANAVHAEDEDAWCIVEYKDVATPSARITGDKDRENPVEGAPYGEGLIGRIDALEAKNELLRRALSYAQDKQISLMLKRRDLEAENARLREALTSEREENLWNAYGTGIVRDGKWDHLCMSGGEWLADQCGFDRKTRRYSDQAIRDAIPIAARQALADMEQADADQ